MMIIFLHGAKPREVVIRLNYGSKENRKEAPPQTLLGVSFLGKRAAEPEG